MSTVPPAPPPPPSVQLLTAAAAQSGPTATVQNPPEAIQRLPQGAALEARVVETRQAVETLDRAVQQARTDQAAADQARAALRQATQAADRQIADRQVADRAQQAPQQAAPPRADNIVRVATPQGDVTLRTPVALPQGGQVALEVVKSTPQQVTLRVVSLNGQPVLQALNAEATPQDAGRVQAQPPTSTAPRLPLPGVLNVGQMAAPGGAIPLPQAGVISAGILSFAGQTGGAGQALPGLFGLQSATPGGQFSVQVTGLQTPNGTVQGTLAHQGQGVTTFTQATPGQATSQSTAQVPGQPGAAAPGAQPTGTPGQAVLAQPGGGNLQPGSTTQGQVPGQTSGQTAQPGQAATSPQPSLTPSGAARPSGLSLFPETSYPRPAQAPPQGVTARPPLALITGTVVATGSQAQPQVQVEGGTVQLNVRANLPQGTQVSFEVLARQAPTPTDAPEVRAATLATSNAAGPPLTANTAWPSVTEALQILQRVDPAAAQQFSQTLPDGGVRTVAAALSFVQAMRTGDLRQWPGDNTLRALERTGPRGAQLARQIAGEVAEMSQRARETGGEWRAMTLPFSSGAEIDRIALITRREGAEDDDENEKVQKKGGGTRFIVDLDLSNLGRMQLDGMVKTKSKAFDLIIRTENPLEQNMKLDLQGLFTSSSAAVGYAGGLIFRVSPEFADPLPQSQKNAFFGPGVWA